MRSTGIGTAMGRDRLNGADALAVLECIRDCLACRSRRDFTALFPKLQTLFPFDHALAVVTRVELGRAVAVDEVNISFPEGWLRAYTAAEGFAGDGVVRRALATGRLLHWSGTAPHLPRPNALDLCRDFQMCQGWVAAGPPLFGEPESVLFCLAGQADTADPRSGTILEHLLPHLQGALARVRCLLMPEKQRSPLSPREREVLNWLKEGKSSWDIAQLLGIRERTVHFHVANLMRKLGTVNRPQTVAVALRRGLIPLG